MILLETTRRTRLGQIRSRIPALMLVLCRTPGDFISGFVANKENLFRTLEGGDREGGNVQY